MLFPSKVKYRKWHKKAGNRTKKAGSGNKIVFGKYGMKALTDSWVSSRQLEAARRVLVRKLHKGGKIWIRIFPDKPVTKKGNEIPMGGGKGSVDHYVFAVEPGRIIFEIDGVDEELAKTAVIQAGYKLPIKVKFVKK